MLQILDDEGRFRKDLEPALTPDELKKIYGLMVMTRVADGKALKLQRQGRMWAKGSPIGSWLSVMFFASVHFSNRTIRLSIRRILPI